MKRSLYLLALLLLAACANNQSANETPVLIEPVVSATSLPTMATSTPLLATTTHEPTAVASSTPTLLPTFTPEPTLTPTPIPPPTGRIYFLWDPLSRPDDLPDPVHNLYVAIPGETANDWEIETVLTELVGIPVIALSPDKTKLAFTVLEDANNDGSVSFQGSAHYLDIPNVFVYSFTDNKLERITDNYPWARNLTWSNDSQRLAYQSGTDVYVATHPIIGEPELLYSFPAEVQELAWSPDDHYLAIGIYNIGIYLFDETTGALINLEMEQQGSNLAWSPDGQWLVSSGFVAVGLNVINATSLDILTLVEAGSSLSTWSPDSRYLAFTQSFRSDLGFPLTSSLFLWNAKSNDTRLVAEAIATPGVVWSPDGRSIVVGLLHEDQSELMRFDVENSVLTTLLTIPGREEIKPLAWSPDGQWLLFYSRNSSESSLSLIHQTGGEVFQLVDTTNTYMPYGVFWLSD